MLLPGFPYFLLGGAGCCIALVALLHRERIERVVPAFPEPPRRQGQQTRLLLGQVAGVMVAGSVLAVALATGRTGLVLLVLTLVALAGYMVAGLVMPRRAQAQANRERRTLRRLTPGFVSYVRIAMAGQEGAQGIFEAYIATPEPARAPMQELVRAALVLMRTDRLRMYDALLRVAQSRGCGELTDIAQALAQAEASGDDVRPLLAVHQGMLEAILRDEQTRTLKRRNIGLIVLVAISVFVGLVGSILYITIVGAIRLGML